MVSRLYTYFWRVKQSRCRAGQLWLFSFWSSSQLYSSARQACCGVIILFSNNWGPVDIWGGVPVNLKWASLNSSHKGKWKNKRKKFWIYNLWGDIKCLTNLTMLGPINFFFSSHFAYGSSMFIFSIAKISTFIWLIYLFFLVLPNIWEMCGPLSHSMFFGQKGIAFLSWKRKMKAHIQGMWFAQTKKVGTTKK